MKPTAAQSHSSRIVDDVAAVLPQVNRSAEMPEYTERQGQYLAFIYYYTKLNGRPPLEADIGRYFRVAPPTAHQMILTLEKQGLISREPGQRRTIRVQLPRHRLPDLE